ncbi:alpha/beta hydrolase, partial [bacterium]|nr:alpha/beta hydrolase [bacterium]
MILYSLFNAKLLYILCAFSFIACTPSLTVSQASHTLALNSKGESFELQINEEENYSFERHQKLLLDSLSLYLNNTDSTPKEVVVYIHGGMLGIRSSVDRSKVFSEAIKKDGKFPVIVNWESSFESSYFVDRLFNVRDGQYWEYNYKTFLHPLLAAVYLPGDILQGVVRSPFQWNEQFLHTKESFYDSTDIDLSTQNIKELNLIYPGARPNSFGRTTGSLFSQYVIPGAIKPVSMIFLDGIGREAWNNMLFKTQALIYGKGINPNERGPLVQVIKLINQTLEKHPNANLSLIGHSMGSIVIANLIREVPELKADNIVHMAAADNIRSLNDVVIPYLQKHPKTQF